MVIFHEISKFPCKLTNLNYFVKKNFPLFVKHLFRLIQTPGYISRVQCRTLVIYFHWEFLWLVSVLFLAFFLLLCFPIFRDYKMLWNSVFRCRISEICRFFRELFLFFGDVETKILVPHLCFEIRFSLAVECKATLFSPPEC